MRFSVEIYEFLEHWSPFLIMWIFAFTLLHVGRILIHLRRGASRQSHNSTIVELAGLPLMLLQSACFFRALGAGDWLSALLFASWGPGFFAAVLYVVFCKALKRPQNWHPIKHVASWLCKINYLLFMLVFFILHQPGMMFVYSVWVINDQVALAWLSQDADRLRRTFHDHWLIRILYPAGLLVPFLYQEAPLRSFGMVYGPLLLVLWLWGIWRVHRAGLLRELPEDPTLLRNMVYFARKQPAVPVAQKVSHEPSPH
jgi:hypothetical protein